MNFFHKHGAWQKASLTLATGLVAILMAAQPAAAGLADGWTRSSTVTDSVINNGSGTWTYNYTVNNTSLQNGGPDARRPILVDWELPWFGDAGITNIASPSNWHFAIETIGVANAATGWEGMAAWQNPADPFYAGAGSPFTTVTQVLHWYNICRFGGSGCEGDLDNAIFPNGSLSDFAFDAIYDSTAAPYQASWDFLPIRTGDPAFPLLGGVPGSPGARGQSVPEPAALSLLGLGLMALAFSRRRRI